MWIFRNFSPGTSSLQYDPLTIIRDSPNLNRTYRSMSEKAFKRGLLRWCFGLLVILNFFGPLAFFTRGTYTNLWLIWQNYTHPKPRSESIITQTIKYQTRHGGLIERFNVTWTDSENEFRSLDVCHFQNLCVEGVWEGVEKQRYWLASDIDRPSISQEANNAFQACLSRMGPAGQRHIGRKAVEKLELMHNTRVIWVSGTTFGFTKDEHRNHPAAWCRVGLMQVQQQVAFLPLVTGMDNFPGDVYSCLARSSKGRHNTFRLF